MTKLPALLGLSVCVVTLSACNNTSQPPADIPGQVGKPMPPQPPVGTPENPKSSSSVTVPEKEPDHPTSTTHQP